MPALTPLPIHVEPLLQSEVGQRPYLCLIYSVGYESRCTYAAGEAVAARNLIAFTFPDQRTGAFQASLAWASVHGTVIEADPSDYARALLSSLRPLLEAHNRVSPRVRPIIGVDISSMSRQRMADTFLCLHRDIDTDLEVDWIYAPATYSGSVPRHSGIVVNGAVRGFEGWGDPSLPATCVVGAGFEADLALGVIDDIEPQEVWALLPHGYSAQHDTRVVQQNSQILESVRPDHALEYRVDQPYETLLKLDSLLQAIVSRSRAVLIPLGPKIFALVCLVLGASSPSEITVWRVSSESNREPQDRKASGDLTGLRISTLKA